ncbi:hypothetical protein KKH23_07070 [Patescibacteria group bacterium]|uniref:Uncharacterized protein n=1 Tax=viral metagenome TaxID=1070528 RepID=A0A6M3M3W1_9ZZZZ|nr:hypothetical protein [Patescibacteria group bacterium]
MTGRWYRDEYLALNRMREFSSQVKDDVYVVERKYGPQNREREYALFVRRDLLALSNYSIVGYIKYLPKNIACRGLEALLAKYNISSFDIEGAYFADDVLLLVHKNRNYLVQITGVVDSELGTLVDV